MNQANYTPFSDIVLEIKKLCDAGKTGALYVATKKNKSAQIMLDRGNIVFVYFFTKRGKDALSLMMEIEAGRFRFQEGRITVKPMNLPPTSEILDYLMSGAKPSEVINIAPTQSTAAAQIQPDKQLSSAEREKLEFMLSKYIGPMAAIICEDTLDTVPDLQTAVEALASEIPDGAKAEKFRDDARAQLSL